MQQPDPITPDVLRLAKARVRPGHIAKELGVTRQRVYMRIGWLRRNGEDIPEFPRVRYTGRKPESLGSRGFPAT